MTTQDSESLISAPDKRDRREPAGKATFVKPQLIWHGAVVDLTNQFGGSLTPEEREARGLE